MRYFRKIKDVNETGNIILLAFIAILILSFLISFIIKNINNDDVVINHYKPMNFKIKTIEGKVVNILDDEIFIDTNEGRFRCPLNYVEKGIEINDIVIIKFTHDLYIIKK